jgi:uncharacterized membrane protein
VGYLDTVVGTAKEQLRHAAGAVAGRMGHHEHSQSVTISKDPETVKQLFRDPDRLSQVLGDIAEVQQTGGEDHFRWVFRRRPLDGTSWTSVLIADSSRLRFVDADQSGDTSNEIVLDFSAAPRGLGTEVTLRVKSPAPALLSGALGFKALYRARALLQTGEIPTIRKNPSARKSAR